MLARLLNLNRKFRPDVLAAVRVFRASKPWRGTLPERKAKFATLHAALCAAYGKTIALDMEQADEVGMPCAVTSEDGTSLILSGKLSVVSYLNRFRYAVTGDGEGSYAWAASLYVRMFPKSASRMLAYGPFIITPETAAAQGMAGLTSVADIIAVLRNPPPVQIQEPAIVGEPDMSINE